MTHWNPGKGTLGRGAYPGPPLPPPYLQKACTSGSRLGNRSVFILDPRLMFMFCFLLLFQPGHLAIPEAYTRPPDLLPHRTDLTIQDTVSSLNSLAAYLVFHRYKILTTNAYSLLILGNQTYHSAPLGAWVSLGSQNSGDLLLRTFKKRREFFNHEQLSI